MSLEERLRRIQERLWTLGQTPDKDKLREALKQDSRRNRGRNTGTFRHCIDCGKDIKYNGNHKTELCKKCWCRKLGSRKRKKGGIK